MPQSRERSCYGGLVSGNISSKELIAWCGPAGRSVDGVRTQSAVCMPASRAASNSFATSEMNRMFGGSSASASGNPRIAFRRILGAAGGVKIRAEEAGQISGGGASEKQLLRQHAAGGKNAEDLSLARPASQGRRHIGIHFAAQFSGSIALLPDFSLQRFQGGALAVAVDQPFAIGSRGRQLRAGRVIRPRRRI